uniref:Uncharacterized protein n=1 Tax=Seriola lalandi dorsalis TaxID=1841481 RepID=A0A3B4WBE7_SERLL
EHTYPTSVYRYDYILAADVVYHHDFLDELLATMKHFCRPGTAVIWANKVRMENDLTFTENFKKAFHTSLLKSSALRKCYLHQRCFLYLLYFVDDSILLNISGVSVWICC